MLNQYSDENICKNSYNQGMGVLKKMVTTSTTVQVHVQPTLIIFQHKPGKLKCEISQNNAKHRKQEA